ncbi:MAG: O-antigen ligase family protein [Parasporobacterium sp.]|nr:O-antigen ligase family protein [Parasporobacterium sp.]
MNKTEKITTDILNSFLGILIFIASMAVFYMPYEIRIIPEVARLLPTLRIAFGAMLLIAFFVLYISRLRVVRDNWFLLAAAGFVGVLIFSTKMNYGDMEGALGTFGLCGLFLVMNIAVFFRVNPKKYLLIAFFLLLAANIVNTWTVFHYWGVGMWETYGVSRNMFYSLIGNYNGGIEYVIPMALCGSAYAHRYGKWLELINYPAMLMSLIMAFKCDSLTQILAFGGVLAFMVIGDIAMIGRKIAKVIRIIGNPILLWFINFAAFITIVVINKSNWVAKLGLDPDFHNRRHIWNMSMDWIARNPIWGSGQETVAVEASKITGYAHSHCTYLEVAYKTGFVGIVFMILMLAAAIVALLRNKHHSMSFMVSTVMFIMGVAAIDETYPMTCIMLCFGLAYYIAKCTDDDTDATARVKTVTPTGSIPAEGHSAANVSAGSASAAGAHGDTAVASARGNISTAGVNAMPGKVCRVTADVSAEQAKHNVGDSGSEKSRVCEKVRISGNGAAHEGKYENTAAHEGKSGTGGDRDMTDLGRKIQEETERIIEEERLNQG